MILQILIPTLQQPLNGLKITYHLRFQIYLTLKNREYLPIDNKRITLIHGSPRDLDEYIFRKMCRLISWLLSKRCSRSLSHTHTQFKKDYSLGTIMNPVQLASQEMRIRKPPLQLLIQFQEKLNWWEHVMISKSNWRYAKAHLPKNLV